MILIADNVARVRERIVSTCARSGRRPEEITLVAVTKNRPREQIEEVIKSGITDIGENKVQEALLKFGLRPSINFHMVGHLQTNKAKDAVRIFELIHSVDSLRLAEEIDKQAGKINKIQNVLLEIKTSPEATKFGIIPQEAPGIFKKVLGLRNIKVRGLMTIAPLVDNPEKSRPYFRVLKELSDNMGRLEILSMGMSDDFEVAIEEGATMVRIGRAIFDN